MDFLFIEIQHLLFEFLPNDHLDRLDDLWINFLSNISHSVDIYKIQN